MNKEFETWWNINKFRLMEDDEVGLREIALAAYLAGKEAAEQSVHLTGGSLRGLQAFSTPQPDTGLKADSTPPASK